MRGSLLFSAALALVLAGCGGGGGGSNGGSNITGATFRIAWPARSRDALQTNLTSALSATVVLPHAATNGTDVTLTVNRDATNLTAHTETYTVPVKVRKSVSSLTATFYAAADGGGANVGSATATVTPQGTSLELANITVVGKITTVSVVPPDTIVAGTAGVQLHAEAKDSSATTVAVSAGSYHWDIQGTTDVFTLSADGTLVPAKAGVANVTVTVDGVTSAPLAVTVAPPPPTTTTLSLTANDLAFDPVSGKIWATVPSTGGTYANSVVSIDPASGTIGTPITVGPEPDLITVSSDGQYAFVTVDSDHTVRRVDLTAGTMGPTVQLAGDFADIAAVPGSPKSFAIATNPLFGVNVSVYDDGVRRSGTGAGGNRLIFAKNDGSLLYGDGNNSLFTDTLSASAITWTGQDSLNVSGMQLSSADGFLYTNSGLVVDPVSKTSVGQLSTTDFLFDRGLAINDAENRVYYVTWDSGQGKRIVTFDRSTKQEVSSYNTGVTTGGALNLVACGNHTVAFNLFGSGVSRNVVIVRNLP